MTTSATINTTTGDQASNRLHRGDVRDFTEAIATFKAQLAHERALQRQFERDCPELVARDEWTADTMFVEDETRADRALALYAETMANAQRAAVAALRLESLTEWADTLESGDYRGLAI